MTWSLVNTRSAEQYAIHSAVRLHGFTTILDVVHVAYQTHAQAYRHSISGGYSLDPCMYIYVHVRIHIRIWPAIRGTYIVTYLNTRPGSSKIQIVLEMDHKQDKKVFIQRDFSQGTAVRFSTDFQTELTGKVSVNC